MSKNVLVLAPHTDDAELGCGGTISKLIAEGRRVISVAFSAAEKSVPEHLPRDILRHESKAAALELGIAESDFLCLDYDVRTFPDYRQSILDRLILLGREYQPYLVFLPSRNDIHQDHFTIAVEGVRAFKRASVLAYDVPWNNFNFDARCFVEIGDGDLEKKISAVSRYESQKGRQYTSEEFIRSQAIMRGVQSGSRYAEAFEVVTWKI